MPGLMIKALPDKLHKQLKRQAKANHRSMAQEALMILEQGVIVAPKRKLPPLYRGKFLLTEEWLDKAKREGRA